MRAYREIDDHFEVKIEKGRLVVLGVGAGLTLLLVFLVGVLVGKGLWGARQDVLLNPSAPVTTAPGVQEREKPQLTFYDDLKKPDSAASQNVMPPAPVVAEPVTETAVPGLKIAEEPGQALIAPKAVSVPTGPIAEQRPVEPPKRPETKAVAEAKAPVANKAVPDLKVAEAAKVPAATKPAAEAAKPPSGAPSYTVQVGSFRDRVSADDQAKKIAAQGVAAQVISAPMEGRTWFRVHVGRYDTRADAESYYQKKLRPKGIQGFVTQR